MSQESHTIPVDALTHYVQRIERLEEEKKAIADDIKSVYDEAKSHGFDPKIMRKVIALRKLEEHERQEVDALVDTYLSALGMS